MLNCSYACFAFLLIRVFNTLFMTRKLLVLQVTVCDASSETQRALDVIRSSGVSQSLPARRESVARLGEKKEQMQRLRNRFALSMSMCAYSCAVGNW